MDDTLRVNGALAPEASLPFLSLSGGSSGVQVLSPLLEQIAVGPTDGTVGVVVRNAATTGEAALLLDANNQAGVAELKALAGGGVMLNAFQQFISFNNTSGLANLAIEPNHRRSNDGEVIFGYGFVNLSDRALKENVRAIPEQELQDTFDAVDPQLYDRIDGGKEQIGFVAQDQRQAGREHVQDEEFGRTGADGSRLPEALGRAVGRGQKAAEAGGLEKKNATLKSELEHGKHIWSQGWKHKAAQQVI